MHSHGMRQLAIQILKVPPRWTVTTSRWSVLARFTPWLHADSVPGTAVDSAMDSAVAVSRRERSGSSHEDPLSCRVEATQHDPVSVSVSRQATPPPALALGAHATNQFFSLATDSDDEQPPTDLRCSDNDSIPEQRQPETKIAFEVGSRSHQPDTASSRRHSTCQEGCSHGCTSCAQSG